MTINWDAPTDFCGRQIVELIEVVCNGRQLTRLLPYYRKYFNIIM